MERRERGGSHRYHLRPQMQLSSTLGKSHKRANKRKYKRESSWKKRKTDDYYERRPWADLSHDLLQIISKNLNIAEYLNVGRVCKGWRSYYSAGKEKFMSSQSPLVIYISTRAKKTCYFYDITTQIRYETQLPYLACNFCLGFSSGHLIMEDLDSNVWVVNPVTGHKLEFPHMPQPGNRMYCSDRAILGSINGSKKDFMVVVLSAMHKNLRYCMSTDNEWKVFSYSEKPWYILDIIIFGGGIVALTNDNQLGIFNLKSPQFLFLNLKGAPRLSTCARFVATDERLVIVDFVALYRLGVYSIDFLTMRWARVRSLDDESLFLGDMMSSRISNATNWGGRGDCVYYLPFTSNTCYVYTMSGQVLGTLPVGKGTATPRMNCWYFTHQSDSVYRIKVKNQVSN